MLFSILLRIGFNILIWYGLISFIPSITITGGIIGIIIAGVLVGVANMVLKPILQLVTLPLRLFTFGLLSFVIHFILIFLVVTIVNILGIQGVEIILQSWKDWVITSIVFTFLNGIIHVL